MLCCYRMIFTRCDGCISILAVSLICSASVFPLLCKYSQWLRAELSRQPRSKWPQMIKNNHTSPVWGRNVQKWREMEKALVEGENWSRQEPILAPIVNIDNIWWQNVKNRIWKFFFHYLRLLCWLINLFCSFKKWELRSPRIFFQISRIPIIVYPIFRIPITPNRASMFKSLGV